MDCKDNLDLRKLACRLRIDVIDMVYHAASGHVGGSLSICDTLAYLYTREMRIDPKRPDLPERDRLVLSKGHACPALYAVLAESGYFPREELAHLRQAGRMLQGHPDMKKIPGVDMTTGSLGQGFSAAVGMALAAKMCSCGHRTYAIVGDGELQEGQVWEAAMLAAHKKLDNLTVIVDNNGLQIDGNIAEVNSPYPICEKFLAFGWAVTEADAHDFESLERAFALSGAQPGKPTAIIQKSIKGKGVSFMEGKASWHGTPPNREQYEKAMSELQAVMYELEAE